MNNYKDKGGPIVRAGATGAIAPVHVQTELIALAPINFEKVQGRLSARRVRTYILITLKSPKLSSIRLIVKAYKK